MQWTSPNTRRTHAIAREILKRYRASGPRPLIFALSGNLGSGKTVFTQGMARSLGIRATVQSPTFVLMKWYKLSKPFGQRRFLVHIDAYRVRYPRDFVRLGIRDIFRDPDAIVVVEWAERIRSLLPASAITVRIRHDAKQRRIITAAV